MEQLASADSPLKWLLNSVFCVRAMSDIPIMLMYQLLSPACHRSMQQIQMKTKTEWQHLDVQSWWWRQLLMVCQKCGLVAILCYWSPTACSTCRLLVFGQFFAMLVQFSSFMSDSCMQLQSVNTKQPMFKPFSVQILQLSPLADLCATHSQLHVTVACMKGDSLANYFMQSCC